MKKPLTQFADLSSFVASWTCNSRSVALKVPINYKHDNTEVTAEENIQT